MTEPIYGGQAVVEALKNENVRHVFGLIGSATMEVFDGLYEANSIRFIGVHDERTGTHMADGYARASGGPGVIVAGQNGPGATNLLTGLAQASAAYSPVVAIAGALSSGHVYRDAFQEVDQHAALSPVTKSSVTVPSVGRIPELFQAGFRTALTPRRPGPGPAEPAARRAVGQGRLPGTAGAGNLPRAVRAGGPGGGRWRRPRRCCSTPNGRSSSPAAESRMAAARPRPSRWPRCWTRRSRCRRAMATPFRSGIRSMPARWGAARQSGGVPASSTMADVIFALGTRLGFNSTFYSYDNINRDAAIVQVEIEPTEIGRHFPVALGIWADAPTVADQLAEAVRSAAAIRAAFGLDGPVPGRAQAPSSPGATPKRSWTRAPIQPSGLFRAFRRVLPRECGHRARRLGP